MSRNPGHTLVCGGCGGEQRSASEQRCHHCGANDPLNATSEDSHLETVGTPEVPKSFGGMTAEQLIDFLQAGNVRVESKKDVESSVLVTEKKWQFPEWMKAGSHV